MPSKSNITHMLLLAVLSLTAITTLPGLSGPLVFDDFKNLAHLLSGETKDYAGIEWHLIKVKLSFMSMFSDVLTCFLTRFVQARIRLGPALDGAWLNPAGSFSYA